MESVQKTPVWLVTGCSTGFGRSIAAHLLEEGFRVVVTARGTERVGDLGDHDNAFAVALDVTDESSVADAVARAEEHFGRIDVVVNNAGIGYFAAVEETSPQTVQRLFDVNFHGVARVVHAVLPGMRARRSGMIVNLTSMGGLVGHPSGGYYCATKFAVEGLSESLRHEVEPLGIHVMTVEPSAFRTNWASSAQETQDPIADYDQTAGAARRAYRDSVGKQAGDPGRAARALLRAVTAPEPPHHLLLGAEAYDVATAQLRARAHEFQAWKDTTRSADFPMSA
ncbi:oxidoreductase [Streptomyces fulvorobeus]|uniref:NAD(P)-dependent dehydrogenase (Short-subunit alcohol dehydrogenase family) n=1 Tax=Streptomyces fulvorobeus TaxID=284028 RepID=A0A7J0CH77_9ACTN|nr:oxidoreductase [Streptomyces fulvorobeus]NYE44531.1 NAD(P)-dependent dehydrogenase (short-subunit alcohol dehydrogenase family) [Streptomyces fulvorobeus]GFN01067.1 short-chain dehydrogenase/reductase [Streptomyces fulvorobeus]